MNRERGHGGLMLPVETVARLHVMPEAAPHRFVVLLAVPPVEATPQALLRAGEVNAIITHDPGHHWPDREGQVLAGGVLRVGGVVAMAFEQMGDALRCHKHVRSALA